MLNVCTGKISAQRQGTIKLCFNRFNNCVVYFMKRAKKENLGKRVRDKEGERERESTTETKNVLGHRTQHLSV